MSVLYCDTEHIGYVKILSTDEDKQILWFQAKYMHYFACYSEVFLYFSNVLDYNLATNSSDYRKSSLTTAISSLRQAR